MATLPCPPSRHPAPRWLVYILRCSDGSLYTGITNNLPKRLKAHAAGRASKYTRNRLPVRLAARLRSRNRGLLSVCVISGVVSSRRRGLFQMSKPISLAWWIPLAVLALAGRLILPDIFSDRLCFPPHQLRAGSSSRPAS